jgi:hypothetical protein
MLSSASSLSQVAVSTVFMAVLLRSLLLLLLRVDAVLWCCSTWSANATMSCCTIFLKCNTCADCLDGLPWVGCQVIKGVLCYVLF